MIGCRLLVTTPSAHPAARRWASISRVPGTSRPYVIHNIGRGAQKEDVLLAWDVIGHYRW